MVGAAVVRSGRSSGLMSFLRIGDRAAGAIKSGGTTRRAAKMVCLDADHPDIESFVNWKAREELKVAAMVEGLKHISSTAAVQQALPVLFDPGSNRGQGSQPGNDNTAAHGSLIISV